MHTCLHLSLSPSCLWQGTYFSSFIQICTGFPVSLRDFLWIFSIISHYKNCAIDGTITAYTSWSWSSDFGFLPGIQQLMILRHILQFPGVMHKLFIMVKKQPINKSCFATLSAPVSWMILKQRDNWTRENLRLIGDQETLYTQIHWMILAPHILLTYLQFLKNLLLPFLRVRL